MSLLATSILPPTSIVHPSSFLFLSLSDISRISRLLLSFRIHEINPLRVLWRVPAQGEASERESKGRRIEESGMHTTHCTYVALYISYISRGRLHRENASQSIDICTEMPKSRLLSFIQKYLSEIFKRTYILLNPKSPFNEKIFKSRIYKFDLITIICKFDLITIFCKIFLELRIKFHVKQLIAWNRYRLQFGEMTAGILSRKETLISNFARDITGCKKDSFEPRDRGQYGRQRNACVIHLERVYYRSHGPSCSRHFARVNTGSEHCYSLYDSLKTISRSTSSPSNPCAAGL